MKKLYEHSWHGIPFSTVARLDRTKVADATFYEAFYREFFRRYRDWSGLDPVWIKYKLAVAEFILRRIPDKSAPTLSVGCGLGFVERHLAERGVSGLEINDSSTASLQWLSPLISESRIHIGDVPDCLPREKRYDLIYLSAVDYCFDNNGLASFLSRLGERLSRRGRCLVVSGSFDPGGWVRNARYLVRRTLEFLGILRGHGQLWGYFRTRREYRGILQAAGYTGIEDGFLENGAYWIEGGPAR